MLKILVARRLAVLMAVVAQTALTIATRLVAPMVVAATTALISFLTIDLVAVHKNRPSCVSMCLVQFRSFVKYRYKILLTYQCVGRPV